MQLALVGQLGVGPARGRCSCSSRSPPRRCLGSGAPGGLFTPTLALGVLLGGLLGHALGRSSGPGAPLGSYAMIGGAAVLGAAMQGPLAAIVLMLELTHQRRRAAWSRSCSRSSRPPSSRALLGAPSIYSARIIAAGASDLAPAAREQTPGAPPDSGGPFPEAPGDQLPDSLSAQGA